MKKLAYLLVLIVIFVVGCTKSKFLKESPVDRFVVGNFYGSGGAAEARAAVDAIYNRLYSIYDRLILLLNELSTDNEKNGLGMPNQNLQDLEYLRYTSENTFIQNMWGSNYSGINRANSAINNIQKMSIDTALQSQLIAEASFLRALYYFNLVRLFGDVPLILKLETIQDAYIPRTPTKDVYAQIIKDLQFAENNLPIQYEDNNTGRATAGAAKVLLGKVYLTVGEFQKCAEKLAEVIDNEGTYGYGLFDRFGDNWNLETKNGKELVFSVQYSPPPGHTNSRMGLQGPKYSLPGGTLPGLTNLYEADIPTMDLYTKYMEGDTRKDVTFKMEYVSPANGHTYHSSIPLFAKYWQEGLTSGSQCSVNTPVLRYADALLMYAEALNEIGQTNEATEILNRVRERAFQDKAHDYTGLSQAVFRKKLYLERRLEFAEEGMRWFVLVRTKRLLAVMKAHGKTEAKLAESNKTQITANAKPFQVLYPIPQHEIDLSKQLKQNTGY